MTAVCCCCQQIIGSIPVVSTSAREATPDEGLQEALEGKVTPEGTSTSKGESTTGGGSEAVSPHH